VKIGVISDTHGNIKALKKLVLNEDVDYWIHLGDVYEDSLYMKDELKVRVEALKGNCDYGVNADEEKVLEIGDHKILLLHGHRCGVKINKMQLFYKAFKMDCEAVLYGHTHIPFYAKHEDIILFNPGSISLPRGGCEPSYGILYVDEKGIRCEIVKMDR
jgi:putative phosphoesterase